MINFCFLFYCCCCWSRNLLLKFGSVTVEILLTLSLQWWVVCRVIFVSNPILSWVKLGLWQKLKGYVLYYKKNNCRWKIPQAGNVTNVFPNTFLAFLRHWWYVFYVVSKLLHSINQNWEVKNLMFLFWGGLPLSICSQIWKSMNLIRERA